jgi:catechol 2,3-dioxygenase
MSDNPPVIAGTRIGHVHLKVADLDRALAFYCGVLGFELTQRLSSGAAFISAGGYHHHIGLNTWESKGGHPPPPGTTGLFHTAILYPTRPALADALHRVMDAGIPLDGASDHGVSEALYLRDPDQNGVELYWDKPKEQWPRKPDGSLAMFTSGWTSMICCGNARDSPFRHCEERSDEAIHLSWLEWIASRSLSSGAHSRDPLARNDGINQMRSARLAHEP